MAEEIIKLPTTPETTKSNGDSSRINSTGNSNSSNSGGKSIPHYLRASTGSCHDNCKYGKKHAFEAKARRPIRKRITTPPPAHDGGNDVEIVVLVDRNKTVIDKPKPSSDSKTVIAESTKIIKREKKATLELKPSSDSKILLAESSKIIKREVSSPPMNLEVSLKQVASNAKESNLSPKLPSPLKPKHTTAKPVSSPNSSASSSGRRYSNANNAKESNVSAKHATSLRPKSVAVNSSSSANASGGSTGGRDGNIKIGKRTGTSGVAVKKVLAPPITSLSSKPSLSRVASLNARKTRSLKIVPPLKNQNRIRRPEPEPKQPSNEKVQEKTLYVIKMESENKALVSVENISFGENNTLVSVENKSPDENTLVFDDNSSSDVNKTLLSVGNRSPDGNRTLESAENGSLAVRSTPSPSLLSPKSSSSPTSPSLSSHEEEDLEESVYSDSEADDSSLEDNENVGMDKSETLEGEYKRRHRKAGKVLSDDKDDNPVKLSFRRGKVVDLQSENNGPRRLRFRRGRVLGENQNVKGEARRRHYKKREDVDGNGANPGSEKVVLRHQDVQGKKDAQGLFNNVIEETASKLVESRRSKVKALVGAFETVISLQDSKPTSNTIS